MLRLIQKFGVTFIGYLVLVLGATFPLYNHDRLTSSNPLDLSFPYYQSFGVVWMIIASIWVHEQMEDKSKGYLFLRHLPVKPSEIVGAKFAVVFISVFIYVTFHCTAFWFISSSPEYFNPSCTLMINVGNLSLFIAGILYLCIYRFGFAKLRIVLFVLMMVFIALPIILSALILPKVGLDKFDIIDVLTGINWMLATAIGLAVYFMVVQWAARLVKTEKSQ